MADSVPNGLAIRRPVIFNSFPNIRLPRRGLWRARAGGGGGPARSVLRWSIRAVVVYAVLWAAVNGGILLASRFATMKTHVSAAPVVMRGVAHFQAVDAHLWRSSAPTTDADFAALHGAGVTTVVDLRQLTPRAADLESERLARFGLHSVMIPVPDGGIPSAQQVRAFLDVVARSRGIVLVHCGAGVGRTGTMVAAYLVATGHLNGRQAMMRMLSVGPPSLEQLAFEYDLGRGRDYAPPDAAVRVVSRVFDEPRLLFNAVHL